MGRALCVGLMQPPLGLVTTRHLRARVRYATLGCERERLWRNHASKVDRGSSGKWQLLNSQLARPGSEIPFGFPNWRITAADEPGGPTLIASVPAPRSPLPS